MKLDAFTFRMDDKQEAQAVLELLVVSEMKFSAYAKLSLALKKAFLDRFGSEVKYTLRSDAEKAKKAAAKELALLDTWLQGKSFEPDEAFGIELCAGRSADELLPPSFDYLHDPTLEPSPIGAIRIALPPDLDGAADWLKGLAGSLDAKQISWATVGYSFYWDSGSYNASETYEWLAPKLVRHPGFSLGDMGEYMTWSSQGFVPHVAWVTALGAGPTKKLGAAKITAAADKAGLTHAALPGGGVLLQAGSAPTVGDVNKGDRCDALVDIGRIIKPVFMPDDEIEANVYIENLDDDAISKWFKRFIPKK